jgi:hypothetical protein
LFGYLVVAVAAAVVGWAVYRLVLRFGPGEPMPAMGPSAAAGIPSDVEEWRGGENQGVDERSEIPVDGAYVPIAPSTPSWQSRAAGLMGLVISVVVAAVTLAFALYSVGHLIARLMSSAASG